VGPLSDPVVQTSARDAFAAELDIAFHTSIEASSAEGGARIAWKTQDGEAGEEVFEYVLAATGRPPNLSGLEIEVAGIELDARGVPLHDSQTGQCGTHPIFLAGDVTGQLALLHEAADEGKIAGFNAAHPAEPRAHQRRTPLAVMFTDPQVGTVGTAFRDLDPERTAMGQVDFADQGRARIMNKNQGIVRVYGDTTTGRLIGAEMVGPRVEHTAHLLAWAIQFGASVQQTLKAPYYHPVVEEGIRTALRSLARQLRMAPDPCAYELDCGPGVSTAASLQ
jgi:dihydrolipoamide dehydrogenase